MNLGSRHCCEQNEVLLHGDGNIPTMSFPRKAKNPEKKRLF
jgi:hypothetical protein